MKISRRRYSVLAMVALLSACGGSSGGNSSGTPAVTIPQSVAPTPPRVVAGCSVRDRQNWAFSVLDEWYLFQETLPTSLDPGIYANVDDYVDALTATARSQRRDRFFTYVTSIAEENAFFSSGASAGFGIRLSTDATAKRTFVAEAFEGAPGLAAGIDRGTEILSIGTDASNLRAVSDIITASGSAGVSNALGPSTVGTMRMLQIRDAAGTRVVSVTKAEFDLTPVSSRYGARTITDNGKQIGYINMRTFISTADPQLKNAFADFRAKGITDFIIDFRYNGGGLVSTAELMSDLLGGNRSSSEILSRTTFRPQKSENDSTRRFQTRPEATSPVKIAFIGTGATASASELVINSLIPFLGVNLALVGSNTFGKPVGQIAIDRSACDDRMRVVAFSTQNANNGGFYYDGLSKTVQVNCRASDDFTKPLGDAQEASVRSALDFIAGRTCSPIAGTSIGTQAVRTKLELLMPDQPTAAQREVPGLH